MVGSRGSQFDDSHTYAVKVFDKRANADQYRRKMIQDEIDITQLQNSPYCTKFTAMKEDKEFVYMIMELAGEYNLDDLQDSNEKCNSKTILSIENRLMIFKQVLLAVQYLHKKSIFHRDIKARNILINKSSNKATLIDYGLSCYSNYKLNFQFCGTASYMAPEIVERKGYDGAEIDCWSLGVLLYRIVFFKYPFGENDDPNLNDRIKKVSYDIPNKELDKNIINQINGLLKYNGKQRLTVTQALNHEALRYIQ